MTVSRTDFRKWVTVPTRWIDQDSMGHVNSATYHTYFEIARMAYFEEMGLLALKVPGKFGPAVVSQTCNYRRQIFHPSDLSIGVRMLELRQRTCLLEYVVFVDDEEVHSADGQTVMAWVDYEQGKAIPLPEAFRDSVTTYEKAL